MAVHRRYLIFFRYIRKDDEVRVEVCCIAPVIWRDYCKDPKSKPGLLLRLGRPLVAALIC